MTMFQLFTIVTLVLSILVSVSHAMPYESVGNSLSYPVDLLGRAAEPYFPDQPPSCPVCQKNYDSINSCAEAAPVFANFSMIIFNPGAFVSVIQCACSDTFESVYPQCVDCFEQTNQTALLNTTDAPAVVDGMRKVCALAGTLLGGVATADGEVTPTSSIHVPVATATTSSGTAEAPLQHYIVQLLCAMVFVGLRL